VLVFLLVVVVVKEVIGGLLVAFGVIGGCGTDPGFPENRIK